MRRIGYRHQRTIASPAEVSGVGFITGTPVTARFLPAPSDAGITFVRTDLPGQPTVSARADAVTGTQRRTTLGPAAASVTLVEHVLAALAGLRIDNCRIELDGPEPPGLDGSAQGFVDALTAAGMTLLPTRRDVWAVTAPVVVARDGATIGLHPPDELSGYRLRVSYILDYGTNSPLARQAHTLTVTPGAFARELACCRTFLLEQEVAGLQKQGVGLHLTAADVLVFGPQGLIGNSLRFADEPARHKVLDLIGDLSLAGFDLAGHVVAYRSGHSLNAALASALASRAATTRKRAA